MKVDVVTEVTIARSRADVASFAGHPSNAPRWYVNIESVEWHGTPEVRIGAKVDFVAHFLGRRLAYTYEIVALEPKRRMVMSTRDGPFPMETSYVFRDAPGGGTRVTLRNRGMPDGFGRLATPLMIPAMKRANKKDLALLKSLLEREEDARSIDM